LFDYPRLIPAGTRKAGTAIWFQCGIGGSFGLRRFAAAGARKAGTATQFQKAELVAVSV
jgi:hypothetical protein